MMARVAVVVPACNEQGVVARTLAGLIPQFTLDHIYVVSDGSADLTHAVAGQVVKNVLRLRDNVGKAKAIERALRAYRLLERYEFVMFTDADSELSPCFLARALDEFGPDTACVIGRVTGRRHNWLTAYRTLEYAIGHDVYKQAQSALGVVLVAPGCASVYRSTALARLSFSADTLTEDLDLTLQIHRGRLGGIRFASEAVVVTQDPKTLLDYFRQIHRWYTGWWQNAFKHRVGLGGQAVDWEAAFLSLEGLLMGAFLMVLPVVVHLAPRAVMAAMAVDFAIMGAYAVAAAKRSGDVGCLVYLPLFWPLKWLSAGVFAWALVAVAWGRAARHWAKVARY
jgi:biofilm PGA synthesis N-glycosyltransferase PgaC